MKNSIYKKHKNWSPQILIFSIEQHWIFEITARIITFVILGIWSAIPAYAQNLYIDEIAIAREIENHSPVEAGFTFPSNVKELSCFTRICGVRSKTTITHVWYLNGQEMAKVDLPVKRSCWRTYSSIKIKSNWKGHWWVDIIHGETNLGGIDFTIE